MPIVCWERARLKAQQLMDRGPPAQPPPGYLYGLPVAVKDLTAVKGVRFTQVRERRRLFSTADANARHSLSTALPPTNHQ